jgi:hypothetical protein
MRAHTHKTLRSFTPVKISSSESTNQQWHLHKLVQKLYHYLEILFADTMLDLASETRQISQDMDFIFYILLKHNKVA